MVLVNRILNVFIFLLAIAACIAAVLLHQRRSELRNRADLLSEALVDIAQKIDADKSNDINATDPDKGIPSKDALNWKAYHEALKTDKGTKEFEGRLETVSGGVEKISALKQAMADSFIEFARINRGPEALEVEQAESLRQALNSTITFPDNVAPIIAKNEKIVKRGEQFTEKVTAITEALKKPQDASNFDIYSDSDSADNDGLKDSLDQIVKQTGELANRTQTLITGYEKIHQIFESQKGLPHYFKPNFNPQAIASENQDDVSKAIDDMYKDVLKQSKLLSQTNTSLAEARSLIDRANTLVKASDDLNQQNAELKNQIARLAAQAKRENVQIEQVVEKQDNAMAPGFSAKVLEFNDRFDFVILNKGKRQGVENDVKMVVHSDGKYICKIMVTKVLEDSSVCDILPVTRLKDDQGNFVLPEIGDEAVVSE